MSAPILQTSSDQAKGIAIDSAPQGEGTHSNSASLAKWVPKKELALDLITVFFSTGLAIALFYQQTSLTLSPVWIAVISSTFFLAFTQCLGIHTPEIAFSPSSLIPKFFYAAVLTSSSLGAVSVLVFLNKIPIGLLAFQSLLLFSTYTLLRAGTWYSLKKAPPKIILLGPSSFCASARKKLRSSPSPFRIESIITDNEATDASPTLDKAPVGDLSQVDVLVIPDINQEGYDRIISDAVEFGIPVSKYSRFFEEQFQRIPVRSISMDWFLFNHSRGSSLSYRFLKRAADILIGVAGITLSLPLILLAGIAIFLTDGGGIFYSQTRLGLRKKTFRIYKLRTMIQNAEQSGAKWAAEGDSRITLVGRILRKTRIDELPQFWNILKGDMSFVGPRPERPEFTSQLEEQIPHFSKRHLVKPGLTGWAQINYPYGASEEDAYEKLTLDLYYIKNASPWLDLKIAFRTIGAAMQGAR